MNSVVEKRQKEIKEAALEGKTPPVFNDVLAWTQDAASARKPEAGDIQLSLAIPERKWCEVRIWYYERSWAF
jgi:hypothetical protein